MYFMYEILNLMLARRSKASFPHINILFSEECEEQCAQAKLTLSEILDRNSKTKEANDRLHKIVNRDNLSTNAPAAIDMWNSLPASNDSSTSTTAPYNALTLSGISAAVRQEVEAPLFRNRHRLTAIEKQRAETLAPRFRISKLVGHNSITSKCSHCNRKISSTRDFVVIEKNADNECSITHFDCVLKHRSDLLTTVSSTNIDYMLLTRKQIDYIRKRLNNVVTVEAALNDASF
eukprot:gene247-436_t